MVEIETMCKIPIWRTFGRIQWHAIPEPPATLQDAATWRIQCHDQSYVSHCMVNSMACHPTATFHMGEFTVMIPKPQYHATLQGGVSWRNQCHDRAALQGVRIPSAILKIVFLPYFNCFVFNAVWALTRGGFRIVSDTLVIIIIIIIIKEICKAQN